MLELLQRYRRLEQDVLMVILAEVCVQFTNAAFFIALLLYMQESGYTDDEATGYFKYRFLGVLALAFPLGRFLRGRAIRPFFYVSVLGIPLCSLLVIHGVRTHSEFLLIGGQMVWGLLFMCMTVTVLPYIMRNAAQANQTAAISLSFSTWSFTMIVAGATIYSLQEYDEVFFSTERLLQAFSLLGALGVIFLLRIRTPEQIPPPLAHHERRYDWGLITRAMVPSTTIAVGAGLTIPFMPLFFANIHGFETRHVGILSSAATGVVLLSIILIPLVKDRFGYRRAIPGTQLIAIGMLVGLALTEYIAKRPVAIPLACLFYILRQPLMNMAGPMISELTMNYVGARNQELVSALNASVWSGSWFLSGLLFQRLRALEVAYVNVFLITAGLYLFGVVLFYLVIIDYDRRRAAGLAT